MKLGIALSAGSAGTMAQVGAIEELAAAGLEFSYVAGTSAGAMVGAAYAAGHLDGLARTMCGLTRRQVVRLFDPTWPRTGLLEGRRAMELIRPHVGERIEELPVPYAAVATDLRSGAEVMLDRGDVVEAIRASIAIPGIFTPSHRDGRLLVDGGLANPLPVSVARHLGAEFVVAISVVPIRDTHIDEAPIRPSARRAITTALLSRFFERVGGVVREPLDPDAPLLDAKNEESGLIEVILSASRIVESRLAAARLREHPADVLIEIPLPRVGIFDFHRSLELIAAGRATARRLMPEIKAAVHAALPLYRRLRGR